MNIWDIAKKLGGEIIKDTIPMGGVVLSAINEFLPDGEKLGDTATGKDLDKSLKSLSPESQAKLITKRYDLAIITKKEEASTVRAMLAAENSSTHTTRPKIAWGAFQLVSIISLAVIFGWLYAVLTKNPVLVKSITDGWIFVGAIIAPFIGWLNNYFGILKSEHENRLRAHLGKEPKSGILDTIINRK